MNHDLRIKIITVILTVHGSQQYLEILNYLYTNKVEKFVYVPNGNFELLLFFFDKKYHEFVINIIDMEEETKRFKTFFRTNFVLTPVRFSECFILITRKLLDRGKIVAIMFGDWGGNLTKPNLTAVLNNN